MFDLNRTENSILHEHISKLMREKSDLEKQLRSRKNWTDKNHRRMLLNYARDIALNRGCKLCGYNKHFAALQFHHRDQSEKVDSVSELIRRGVSLQRVKDEIEKCDVLCTNCHMVITSEQLGWYN